MRKGLRTKTNFFKIFISLSHNHFRFLEPQKIHLFRTKCASWSKAKVLSEANPSRRISKCIEHPRSKNNKNRPNAQVPPIIEGVFSPRPKNELTNHEALKMTTEHQNFSFFSPRRSESKIRQRRTGLRQLLYTCRENSTNQTFLCKTNPISTPTTRISYPSPHHFRPKTTNYFSNEPNFNPYNPHILPISAPFSPKNHKLFFLNTGIFLSDFRLFPLPAERD